MDNLLEESKKIPITIIRSKYVIVSVYYKHGEFNSEEFDSEAAFSQFLIPMIINFIDIESDDESDDESDNKKNDESEYEKDDESDDENIEIDEENKNKNKKESGSKKVTNRENIRDILNKYSLVALIKLAIQVTNRSDGWAIASIIDTDKGLEYKVDR